MKCSHPVKFVGLDLKMPVGFISESNPYIYRFGCNKCGNIVKAVKFKTIRKQK